MHAFNLPEHLNHLSLSLSVCQNGGRVWPAEWLKSRATSRSAPLDARFGNVSLIPLRGSENEMRNSVAAFTADPLAVSLISQSQQGRPITQPITRVSAPKPTELSFEFNIPVWLMS